MSLLLALTAGAEPGAPGAVVGYSVSLLPGAASVVGGANAPGSTAGFGVGLVPGAATAAASAPGGINGYAASLIAGQAAGQASATGALSGYAAALLPGAASVGTASANAPGAVAGYGLELLAGAANTGAPAMVYLGGGGSPRRGRPEKGSYLDRLLSPPLTDRVQAAEPAELSDADEAPDAAEPRDPQATARALGLAVQATDASRRSLNAALKAQAQQQTLEALRQALIQERQLQERLASDQDEDDALIALLLSL